VLLTLMVGIGINVGAFTAFNALYMAPLPVHDPAHLLGIQGRSVRNGEDRWDLSYPEYFALRDAGTPLRGLAAFARVTAEAPYGLSRGLLVSDNYFEVLEGNIALGRGFAPEELSVPGAYPVLILSHNAWKRRFQSDPQIVAKTVSLDGASFTIVGVAQSGFGGLSLDIPDFWAPVMAHAALLPGSTLGNDRHALEVFLVGRLPRGLSAEQAKTALGTAAKHLSVPGSTIRGFYVFPQGTWYRFQHEYRGIMLLLFGFPFGLVLLISCANVANLLLARSRARRREIAVRLGLGASRTRIIRQLLTENGVLALASGLLSLVFAQKAAELIVGSMPYTGFHTDAWLDVNVAVFTLLVSLGASFFSGFTPARESAREDLVSGMRGEAVSLPGRGGTGRASDRVVVVQMAVCLVVLVGTGLMIPRALRASFVDPGFTTDNVYYVRAGGERQMDDDPAARPLLWEYLQRMPWVRNIAMVPQAPGGFEQSTTLGGLTAQYRYITPQFFQALEIPVVRGRAFSEDEASTEAAVVMISQTAAAALFPGQEPIGRTIGVGAGPAPAKAPPGRRGLRQGTSEVVGVVKDVAYCRTWAKPNLACVYLPTRPGDPGNTTIVVRTQSGSRAALESSLRATLAASGSRSRLYITAASEALYVNSLALTFPATLASVLALVALVLTTVGLYAMMSYLVSQRTHEIGIRMAMGAQPRTVLWLILRGGLKLAVAGTLAGLLVAAGVYRALGLYLQANLFDPAVYAVVLLLLVTVCLTAAYIPARRARRLDPLVALRHE
jgi:putative ABC transport system permease protein